MAAFSTKDYSLRELMRLTGYSDRTIRRYIDLGLVPAPTREGRKARFSREHLGRFWAIACRRREDQWGSPDVRSELEEMTPEQALEWADRRDPLARPEAAATPMHAVLPSPAPPADPAPMPTQAESASSAHTSALAEPLRWSRVSLLPGLDLMVREGASEVVIRLAREIVAKYGAT